jgi:hypothetical protein
MKIAPSHESMQPAKGECVGILIAHSRLDATINASLLYLLPSSATLTVQALSIQDRLALLLRLLAGRQCIEFSKRERLHSILVACSTALATADSVIFKLILAPGEIMGLTIRDASTALDESRDQLESLFPLILKKGSSCAD